MIIAAALPLNGGVHPEILVDHPAMAFAAAAYGS
jgi:hypothetical protein